MVLLPLFELRPFEPGPSEQVEPVSSTFVAASPAWQTQAVDLEAFELVILRRPDDARSYDEATLERIQREHLAYQESLRADGHIVTNGPVLDQPDESMRGLAFYRTGSLDETRRLAEQDPAVQAGRLAVDVMTWWCRPGTMIRPGKSISVPDP
jgi:uncharacterized protein